MKIFKTTKLRILSALALIFMSSCTNGKLELPEQDNPEIIKLVEWSF